MRLFVAIAAHELNFNPRDDLRKIRTNLDKKKILCKWIPQENLHISLCFLGERAAEEVGPISEELKRVSGRHSPFVLRLAGLSAFPSEREGRVIWIGTQNSIALRRLFEDCHQSLKNLGLPLDDRDFEPHLTVGRLRNSRNIRDALSPLKNHDFGEVKVPEIILYESKLGGAFPIYQPVEKFLLSHQTYEKSENDRDEDSRCNREVEGEIILSDINVAGKSSNGKL